MKALTVGSSLLVIGIVACETAQSSGTRDAKSPQPAPTQPVAQPDPTQPVAQPDPTQPVAQPEETPPVAPGGYAQRDPKSDEIKQAADAAVALLRTKQNDPSIKLTGVVAASSQVVAGVNFRLELSLQTAKGPKTVTVVMYRNLEDKATLTSVEGL